jgi:hypothetical protein
VPADPVETPGEGIEGTVEGRTAIVGGTHFVSSKLSESGAISLQKPKCPVPSWLPSPSMADWPANSS